MPKAMTARATKSRSLLILPRRDPNPKASGRFAALFDRQKQLKALRADLEYLEKEWESERDELLEELAANEAALY